MFAWIRLLLGRREESRPVQSAGVAAITAAGEAARGLPARLKLHDCAYRLDGGTISLAAIDEAGEGHSIVLVQHRSPGPSASGDAIPGRLYFDRALVPMRSELESQLLRLLRAAECLSSPGEEERGGRAELSPNAVVLGEDIRQMLTRSPEDNLRALRAEVVSFVESEAYLFFAGEVERAADQTAYDIWVEWAEGARKQAIVAVGNVLNIGVKAARDFLDQGAAVARAVRAAEVMQLNARFRALGLGIRVEPAFPWRLER
jgi:ribosomal protein L7/L12